MKRIIAFLLCLVGTSLCWGITAQEGKAIFQKAQAGDAEAQYQLAECFAKGDGLKADPKQAKAWYQKAAAQQHELAKEALKEITRLARKGAVAIKKDVSPDVRKAKGLELIEILTSESSYESVVPHEVIISGKRTMSKAYTQHYDNMLKPDIMKQVIDLTKDGADLDLCVNIDSKPYKILTKVQRPSSCSLKVAVKMRAWDLLEFLLANGVNHKGSAGVNGFFMDYLLDTRFDQSMKGSAYQRSLAEVQKMIDLGLDLNDCYSDLGQTMLCLAMMFNSPDLVELLIKAGADVNGRNSKEQCMVKNNKVVMNRVYDTPFMGSNGCTGMESMLVLLKYNPDLNARGADGKTVLDLKDDYMKIFAVQKDDNAKELQKLGDKMEAILVGKGAKRSKDL